LLLVLSGCNSQINERIEISLNGAWELTRTDSITALPRVFERKVPVYMINDTREDWKGNMRLYISAGDETNIEEKGEYKLVAEIIYRGESVKSIRDFAVQ